MNVECTCVCVCVCVCEGEGLKSRKRRKGPENFQVEESSWRGPRSIFFNLFGCGNWHLHFQFFFFNLLVHTDILYLIYTLWYLWTDTTNNYRLLFCICWKGLIWEDTIKKLEQRNIDTSYKSILAISNQCKCIDFNLKSTKLQLRIFLPEWIGVGDSFYQLLINYTYNLNFSTTERVQRAAEE